MIGEINDRHFLQSLTIIGGCKQSVFIQNKKEYKDPYYSSKTEDRSAYYNPEEIELPDVGFVDALFHERQLLKIGIKNPHEKMDWHKMTNTAYCFLQNGKNVYVDYFGKIILMS